MIVYSSTKSEFRQDVRYNRIEQLIHEAYLRNLGHSTSKSEIKSWKNSMLYMGNILEDEGIPDNTGVAIEYKIPQTSKRIDFILTGTDDQNKSTAVIVELKQWSDVRLTDKDGIVKTFIGGAEREVNHPSYQAWTYAAFLEDYNEAVQEQRITLKPCAYLHNMEPEDVIKNLRYQSYLNKAPSFIRSDAERLTVFIKQFIRYGDAGKVMFEIDNGKIRPSKNLADKLLSMLQGNEEFFMIDDQKLVYETALNLSQISTIKDKHVLIVEGGPGTGKSVVAINLLVELTVNTYEKSGLYQNLGENQIKEIIQAAKSSVFFIDEDQRVTWKDIGEIEEIKKWAKKLGATVHCMELQSQFRCNGSDGYLAWLDNVLEIKKTANETLEGIDFDFRVFDSPNMLHEAILNKNGINNKARLVAGYCWDWVSKKPENKTLNDIVIDKHNFAMQWNLTTDGSLWIRKPGSVNEVGCIHTCQGLEVDYIGVILGPDIVVRNGELIVQPDQRAKTDQSLKGYKKAFKENPEVARNRAEAIIKNTYRTLMSRGQKGCYIYSTDPETNEYFSELSKSVTYQQKQIERSEDVLVHQDEFLSDKYQGLTFKILKPHDVKPYENSVPIYDLRIAAGKFSDEQQVVEYDWVELPDSFRPQKGHFVTRVVGESMNKRIPNGAWCLFKENPGGSRNNKVVIVQHRDIQDQDTGTSYTVKIYCSEKKNEGDEWRHSKIVLRPDSYIEGYVELVLEKDSLVDLSVIGELIAVLG